MSKVRLKRTDDGWKVTRYYRGWKDVELYQHLPLALSKYLEWLKQDIIHKVR